MREKVGRLWQLANESSLRIDRATHYERDEKLWVDAEFYLYGELTNAGGKRSPNIHLDTEEFGVLKIATDKDYLKEADENRLYRKFGVRVEGRQNLKTFERDRTSLKCIDLFEYEPVYSDEKCEGVYQLLAKAKPLSFQILSLKTPHHEAFGELNWGS